MTAGPPAPVRARLLTAAGLALSLGMLAWVLHRVNLSELARAMASVSLGWLAAALAAKLVPLWLKALRWGILLRSALGAWPRRIVRSSLLGVVVNALLPGKLGEVVKIQLLRRHNTVTFTGAAATVVLERANDGAVLLALLTTSLVLLPVPSWILRGALVGAALTAVLLLILALLARRRASPERPPELGDAPYWRRVEGFLNVFSSGLTAAQSPAALAPCAAVTLLAWLVDACGTFLAFRAFHLDLAWPVALLLTSVVALGIAVPQAPAGVGTHQALYVVCLGIFGVAPEVAVGLSVMMTALVLSSQAALGLAFVWHEGLTLDRLLGGGAGRVA